MQGFPTDFAPLLRFLLVGVLNTAFGYLLFALLLALGLKVPLALLLATVGGVLFNF
jgi:putative flippase GtrA